MDLFGTPAAWIEIELTDKCRDAINLPTEVQRGEKGGIQNFLDKCQAQMTGNRLRLSLDGDVETAIRYGTQYGSGGYQARLREVVPALGAVSMELADAIRRGYEPRRKKPDEGVEG